MSKFCAEYAKRGTSSCKKCKQSITKGELRIAKIVPNPFTEAGGDMKQWFHPPCCFETFAKARATTKVIEDPSDIDCFNDLDDEGKDIIRKLITDLEQKRASKKPAKSPAKRATPKKGNGAGPSSTTTPTKPSPAVVTPTSSAPSGPTIPPMFSPGSDQHSPDDSFRSFRRVVAGITDEASYLAKTKVVSDFIKRGSEGAGYKGDVYTLIKLLIPGVIKRVYNLQSKQLVKHFSLIFGTSLAEMMTHLEQGDISETVKTYFEQSDNCPPVKKGALSIQDVDHFLDRLAGLTKDDDQLAELRNISKYCTSNDLKVIIRLIKGDLRMNAGAKHVLDSLDGNAYDAFQASRDLRDVIDRIAANKKEAEEHGKPGMAKKLSIRATLMTPVLPMLAEACKTIAQALRKCPNGMYSEIKYDGERVQVHKNGDKFEYFSRSLKPVLQHKVSHVKDFIPKACPHGHSMILDSEVLLVDVNTSKPLPFGTLGIHKKSAFQDATVCLFIFDILHLNGENLMDRTMKERKRILEENLTEIPNRIMLSESKLIHTGAELRDMITMAIKDGLEGLVLKDTQSVYEPGKRHWLKVKKDYLSEGAMADSADLVVLGAYYGTGSKGGLMSVFLMGCYNNRTGKWCTVTKCGNGHDDSTIDKINKELDTVKISKDIRKVPDWLNIHRNLLPDFVVADPKAAPVWEITGAEFSKSDIHTADGVSIRFPRVTKIRDDKDWKTATDVQRLKDLFKQSKENTDIVFSGAASQLDNLSGTSSPSKTPNNSSSASSSPKKQSASSSPKKTPSNTSSPARPQKRKMDDAADSSSSPSKKPNCRFGDKCFQTNPQHLNEFFHPQPLTDDVLPNVFTGVRVHIPDSTDKYETLKRYVIAFDGNVISDFELSTATHIIVNADETKKADVVNPSVHRVSIEWFWDSIKQQTCLPVDKYQPA